MMGPVTRSILAASTLTAALLLGGCSGVSSGEAAVIDGRSISMRELQETTTQLNEVSTAPSDPAQVLTDLTKAPLLDDVMDGSTFELTEQSVSEVLRAAGLERPTELTLDVARTRQYLALLQDPGLMQDPAAEGVVQRLQALTVEDFEPLNIEVNPRFGAWDPTTVVVGEQVPDWIVPSG